MLLFTNYDRPDEDTYNLGHILVAVQYSVRGQENLLDRKMKYN